jgi:hypothetical protein
MGRQFVARFKNRGDRAAFQTFLMNNYSQEEYFGKLAARVAPAKILEEKGYISTGVKQLLKRLGYTPDLAGRDLYIKQQVSRFAA